MKSRSKTLPVKQIRIVIADDHPVVREGLSALVAFQKDMQVVSEAANGQQAVQKFFLHRPDALLLDLRMPEMNGIQVIHTILERVPEAKIIVLSTYDGDEDVYQAMKAGAKGYLLKDSPATNCWKPFGPYTVGNFACLHQPRHGWSLTCRSRG